MTLNILLTFLTAFAISYTLIPALIGLARKKQLFDVPEGRKAHAKPVPALGGLAIFFGFWMTALLFVDADFLVQLRYLLIAAFLLALVGIKDDLLGVDAFKRIIHQCIVVCLLYYSGIEVEGLYGLFGYYEIPSLFRFPLTLLFLLILINAYNLIDGIDGLAGSLALISSMIFALLFYLEQQYDWMILALALSAATLGFLQYNFNQASIFMGDNGSTALGFLIGVFSLHYLSISSGQVQSLNVVALVFSLIAIPVLDLFRVSMMRLLKGQSPFNADRSHLHHILLNRGFSTPFICGSLVVMELALVVLAVNVNFEIIGSQLLFLTGALMLMIVGLCWLKKVLLLHQNDSVFSK